MCFQFYLLEWFISQFVAKKGINARIQGLKETVGNLPEMLSNLDFWLL